MTTNGKNWRGLFADSFGLLFAALWTARGAQAAHLTPIITVLLIAVPSLVLLAGFFRRDIILRQPERATDKALLRRAKRTRIVLIFAASWWAHATHHMTLFLPLLGTIIGLSYILLARALNEPVHFFMGGAVILVSALSFLLTEPLHLEVAGFGTALCVWIGCILRLWRANILSAASKRNLDVRNARSQFS